ncbi:DUF1501 domain-containing protein [Niveibacterium sp. 24ML]|uniref:DUF1501 domain-containing protein n=1 Tax=Niveibacterium sp. 24ML TaxID=2985512 RepID=UPI002271EE30|nr:DUF1501 domain-containing protein [Niveibacterium sp. 24ML]MCX9155995.1 DUF1501 domain-containing protein [Niveibacterium sp. 24ML]
MKRRDFLRTAAHAGGLSAAASIGLLGSLQAQAATAPGGYKALVCVFLYGGNDGLNTVVPRDAARYAQYAGVRKKLAVAQADLIPLGADYGLHPSLAALAPLWQAGVLAPVFNVGPLAVPLSKADLKTKALPDNLFSHSDQQTLWECAGRSVLARTGWGGRLAAQAGIGPVIALGSAGRFGSSDAGAALALPGPGEDFSPGGWFGGPNAARRAALETMARASYTNRLMQAYGGVQKSALDTSAALGPVLKLTPGATSTDPIDLAFGKLTGALNTPLAKQLYQVAKLIRHGSTNGSGPQVFVVAQGGYDTHADQLTRHPKLLAELGPALAAFYDATLRIGQAQAVTSFTMSDFGRTFAPNSSSGTDHAWGNHQLVIGGAVSGGKTYGQYPELVLGGKDDVGVESWERHGRWIPTIAVEQYAATLARWFGLSPSQIAATLPGLGNFPQADLGFMLA